MWYLPVVGGLILHSASGSSSLNFASMAQAKVDWTLALKAVPLFLINVNGP